MFWSLKIKYTLHVCIHLPLQCFCQRKLFFPLILSQKILGSSGCFKWKMPINYLEIYVGLFSSLDEFINQLSVIISVKTQHVIQISFNTLWHQIMQKKKKQRMYDIKRHYYFCVKPDVLVWRISWHYLVHHASLQCAGANRLCRVDFVLFSRSFYPVWPGLQYMLEVSPPEDSTHTNTVTFQHEMLIILYTVIHLTESVNSTS